MIPITTVVDPRTLSVQVYADHLSDGEMNALGKTLCNGRVFYLTNEQPGLFHLHSHGDNNKHLILTHTWVIER